MLTEVSSAISPFQVEFIFGAAGLACLAVLFIVFLFIAVWVYRDAESRGMGGALWLIIVLIANIFGLIIYLIVRKDRVQPMAPMMGPPQWAPPPGGAPPPSPPSGGSAPAGAATCKNCGSPLAPGATFCGKCGAQV